ncbi:MAG: hypothetical protein J5986_00625 [Roseburia sp.]|nr:hypothetical protein [Roseburia sp.]
MELKNILAVISAAFLLVGDVTTFWQLYKLVETDSASRGLKRPKLWGIFAAGGNNSSGLPLYLLKRRQYPVLHPSESLRAELNSRKKKAGIGLIFAVVGMIGFICFIVL